MQWRESETGELTVTTDDVNRCQTLQPPHPPSPSLTQALTDWLTDARSVQSRPRIRNRAAALLETSTITFHVVTNIDHYSSDTLLSIVSFTLRRVEKFTINSLSRRAAMLTFSVVRHCWPVWSDILYCAEISFVLVPFSPCQPFDLGHYLQNSNIFLTCRYFATWYKRCNNIKLHVRRKFAESSNLQLN